MHSVTAYALNTPERVTSQASRCKARPAAPPAAPGLRACLPPNHLGLSWLVAFTACFLMVGVAGFFRAEEGLPTLLTSLPGAGEGAAAPAGMEVMLEMPPAESPVEQATAQEMTALTEVPPIPEIVELNQELPEMEQPLAVEDLFIIPAAPRVETALRPVDPVSPQPKAVAKPAARATSSASSTRPGSPSNTGSAGGAGAGGPGTMGTASSRGRFVIPRPAYPSALRALGVSGTVRLSIQVGASGRAESVTVLSSSGSAALDAYAASWVKRNGRGPAGAPANVIAPLSFVLR